VCPYHSWTYGLDGALRGAGYLPTGFDKASHGLHPCHVATCEGLIFLHLGAAPADFAPIGSALRGYLAASQLENTKVCHTQRQLVRCNWKMLMENFQECYHCTNAHPEYSQVHAVTGTPGGPASDPRRIAEACAIAKERGLPTDTVRVGPGKEFRVWRTAVREGYATESRDGALVAPLLGSASDAAAGIIGMDSIPTLWAQVMPDHAIFIRFNPRAADLTEVEATWLVRGDAVAGRDYDVNAVTWLWQVTGAQDYVLCENNQAGVASSRYSPGPYSTVETNLDQFVAWYLEQIRDPGDLPSIRSTSRLCAAAA
jgi:phenylpropionate dioxygenase-like ring-hydroxylating dioxygenase large terminal subunit